MERWLRFLGRLEGCSFLLLLLVAMPLKYLAGMPDMVRIMGPVHGVLFLAFCAWACWVGLEQSWSVKKHLLAYLSAIIPLGTFWFEHRYLKDTNLFPTQPRRAMR